VAAELVPAATSVAECTHDDQRGRSLAGNVEQELVGEPRTHRYLHFEAASLQALTDLGERSLRRGGLQREDGPSSGTAGLTTCTK
jgi:hypothetical protein